MRRSISRDRSTSQLRRTCGGLEPGRARGSAAARTSGRCRRGRWPGRCRHQFRGEGDGSLVRLAVGTDVAHLVATRRQSADRAETAGTVGHSAIFLSRIRAMNVPPILAHRDHSCLHVTRAEGRVCAGQRHFSGLSRTHPIMAATFAVAAFPPKRNSDELKRYLPASFHIGAAKIRAAQLPASVTDANGRIYSRPKKWTQVPPPN